jgi:hypothetical protein
VSSTECMPSGIAVEQVDCEKRESGRSSARQQTNRTIRCFAFLFWKIVFFIVVFVLGYA